jgi:hypothetical protein
MDSRPRLPGRRATLPDGGQHIAVAAAYKQKSRIEMPATRGGVTGLGVSIRLNSILAICAIHVKGQSGSSTVRAAVESGNA